jgi:hypothetical protein
VYETTEVPLLMPVTWPVAGVAVALVLFTLHTPPEVPFANDTIPDIHTEDGPVIAPGKGFTVTVVILKQPFGKV